MARPGNQTTGKPKAKPAAKLPGWLGGDPKVLAYMAAVMSGKTPPPTQAGPAAPAPAAAQAAPPPITPFNTPEEDQAYAQFKGDTDVGLSTLDRNKADAENDTALSLQQNERAAIASRAAALEDASSRGIFQSSIKDANIYDVEAQKAMQQSYLNNKLASARIDYETQRKSMNDRLLAYEGSRAAQAVSNASAISANQTVPDPGVPAAPAPAAAPAKAMPPSVSSGRGASLTKPASKTPARPNTARPGNTMQGTGSIKTSKKSLTTWKPLKY